MRRILLLLLLFLACAGPALAQVYPSAKPPPLGAPMDPSQGPPPAEAPGRCAAPLAAGCLRMQSSCQVACPPMWSMNPGAPAFTPTDRAGCMQRCLTQYLSCRQQYGC